ncbi:methyl-accepting chemotaxis sensory transducer [Vogesella fluminis]|uniref:Methyl-accepting chemotaxis sensory transducer n=1 Tax=Vogesella fluminis TaxID=1069161 RepID=A0ABQ3H8J6_9NEIS|nr:methyl-accepting chemotaxis sensory transducer [Vogesella fluminis]
MLLLVPVVSLLLFAGSLLWHNLGSYRDARQTLGMMEISVAAGNLIHALQIERGASAGFLQSHGQKFASRLSGIRAETGQRLQTYRQLLATRETASPEQDAALNRTLARVDEQLMQLAALRTKVDQLQIEPAASSAYYSATVAAQLDAMSAMGRYNQNVLISRKLLAYQALIRTKENAGLERALSVPVFIANAVTPQAYRTILSKVYKQDAFLELFRSQAEPEELASLQSALDSPAAAAVQRLRDRMAEQALSGGFDVDPEVWFTAITDKINLLYTTEQLLTRNVVAQASAIEAAAWQKLLWLSVLVLAALLLTVIGGLRIAHGIVRPLQVVAAAAEQAVSSGDFSRRVAEQGAEELQRTSQAFNHLMQTFSALIADTQRGSSNIAAVSAALASSSTQIQHSAASQGDATAAVAAAVEQASGSISETLTSTRAAVTMVEQTRQDTEHALAVMVSTVGTVQGIAVQIETSGSDVGQLDESSKKIGGIVQVIKDIADQTNLLALNAAIEAARAGEQGRGFAVVADEVRKLAERTGGATGEIVKLISDIQQRIGSAIDCMQQANSQAQHGLQLVSQSESALRNIDHSSQQVAHHMHSVASAIQAQDGAIQQIVQRIEQIANMTAENVMVAQSNNRNAEDLDSLSNNLQRAISQFRIAPAG